MLFVLASENCASNALAFRQEGAFLPAFIGQFARNMPEAAREVWIHAALRSRTRGASRYRSLVQALRLLPCHPACRCPDPSWNDLASRLEAWLAHEIYPSPENFCLHASRPEGGRLKAVLDWSKAADLALCGLKAPPPFASALAALERLSASGDVLVLSQETEAALRREWKDSRILACVSAIDGPERGPRAACLASRAAGRGGRGKVLLIGDTIQDMELARSSGLPFYPIIPGKEDSSWDALSADALQARAPLADFLSVLSADPPWKKAAEGLSPSREAS